MPTASPSRDMGAGDSEGRAVGCGFARHVIVGPTIALPDNTAYSARQLVFLKAPSVQIHCPLGGWVHFYVSQIPVIAVRKRRAISRDRAC